MIFPSLPSSRLEGVWICEGDRWKIKLTGKDDETILQKEQDHCSANEDKNILLILKPNQIYRAFGEKKIVKLNNFIIIINSILVMRMQ